jgi:hypothetical protein
VILHGWARGGHENISNAKKSRLAWVLVASMAWTLCQLPQLLITPRDSSRQWILLAISAILLIEVYMFGRRRSSEHPGLIQVRLSQTGCVQYDNLAAAGVLQQLLSSNLWIVMLAVSIGLIGAFAQKWIDAAQFWILFFFPVVSSKERVIGDADQPERIAQPATDRD